MAMAVGYFETFGKIWKQCWIEWEERGPTKAFLTDFIKDVSSYSFISANDILLCLILGVFFTILRYFLTEAVFKVRGYFSIFFFSKNRVGQLVVFYGIY